MGQTKDMSVCASGGGGQYACGSPYYKRGIIDVITNILDSI